MNIPIRVRIWSSGPWWNRCPRWEIEYLVGDKWVPIPRVYE